MSEEKLDWLGNPCWFCGQASPVEGASSEVRLRKMVGSGEFLQSTVSVPRCLTCQAGHGRVNKIAGTVALAGAIAAGTITFVWDPFDFPVWGDILAILLAAGPGGMLFGSSLGLPEGLRPQRTGATYTGVLLMLKNGWFVDDTEMNQDAQDALRAEIEGRARQG